MNFYQARDQARGSTRLLVLLFLLVNLALILLVNFLFASYMWANDDSLAAADKVLLEYLSWQRLLGVSVAVALLLFFASWLKWLDVSQGGGAIAEALGGSALFMQHRTRYSVGYSMWLKRWLWLLGCRCRQSILCVVRVA